MSTVLRDTLLLVSTVVAWVFLTFSMTAAATALLTQRAYGQGSFEYRLFCYDAGHAAKVAYLVWSTPADDDEALAEAVQEAELASCYLLDEPRVALILGVIELMAGQKMAVLLVVDPTALWERPEEYPPTDDLPVNTFYVPVAQRGAGAGAAA